MPLSELKILLIEDNLSMIQIYKNILTPFSVKHIIYATSVDEAKNLVETEKPDLIICDFILNGNDAYNNGLVFLKWIRQVEMAPLCFTPVLMATGHASRRMVLEFAKYGASEVIVKPLSPAILKQRLDSILADARPYIVEAGRVFIKGSFHYSAPKKERKLVYDPEFLSRLVKNNNNPNEFRPDNPKIELLEDDD